MPRKKKAAPVPIGKKIKKARTSKKYSLDHVANETGFAIDYLKEVENGKSPMLKWQWEWVSVAVYGQSLSS